MVEGKRLPRGCREFKLEIVYHNPNIGFMTKCGVQGMESNDSQVHSHFGSCTSPRVPNVQSLGWKAKQVPNLTFKIPLKRYWSVDA
jgi:hypothetical protein